MDDSNSAAFCRIATHYLAMRRKHIERCEKCYATDTPAVRTVVWFLKTCVEGRWSFYHYETREAAQDKVAELVKTWRVVPLTPASSDENGAHWESADKLTCATLNRVIAEK